MALRIPRRQKKRYSLVLWLVVVVLVVFVAGRKLGNSGSPSVIVSDYDVHDVFSRLWRKGTRPKDKTVPYFRTDAATRPGKDGSQVHLSPEVAMGVGAVSTEEKLSTIESMHRKVDENHQRLNLGRDFYDKVFSVLAEGAPSVEQLDRYRTEERIYHARYTTREEELADDIVFSEDYLGLFLQLTDEEQRSMQQSHLYAVTNIPDHAPEGLYLGNGIVYVGGGKYNWLAMLSIKQLRETGCKLPIEIVIPKLDEYEPDLCMNIFPALGARCIFLPYMLSSDDGTSAVSKFKFKGYQYKALAIMVLSFENVLLLDGDNIPVGNPDHLFTEKPFTNNGFIVWPDFWKRTVSPAYYQIAGIQVSQTQLHPRYDEVAGKYEDIPFVNSPLDLQSVPLHQRKGAIPDPTSESGQLMISKSSHMQALILALYYNIYGPTHFYPLFLQGSDGEGDKETFLAATCALNKPFYQVAKFLNALGYIDNNKQFVGTGMGQFDPVDDYKRALAQKTSVKEKEPKLLFLHANFPKLDPWILKTENKIFDEDGKRFRLYGTAMRLKTGVDFEMVMYKNMRHLLCELNIKFETFSAVSRDDLCQEINVHIKYLSDTEHLLE